MSDQWTSPNEYVLDRALDVIRAQASVAVDFLDDFSLHFHEITSMTSSEAIKALKDDLTAVADGERDAELRDELSKEGGDYGMLAEYDNLIAACHQLIAVLTRFKRHPLIPEPRTGE